MAALAFILAQLIGLLTIHDVLTRGFDPGRFAVCILIWFALNGCDIVLTVCGRYLKECNA
jgi:hypothetical protein